MNKKGIFFLSLSLLTGCHRMDDSHSIVSIQMVDRNGFSETISNNDRLQVYEKVDFLTSQPYQKVLRVFKKDGERKSHSKLTTYHPNGGIWQYLEAVDGRAHGRYLEWHENGKPKIEGKIIEGMADFNELAQKSWLFDEKCFVWDEEGNLLALFQYEKGRLQGKAEYYYSNGEIEKIIPYEKGLPHGNLTRYDEKGTIIEEITYKHGLKQGKATAVWPNHSPKYIEEYEEGLLIQGIYYDSKGIIVTEIENGEGIKAEFDKTKLYSLIQYQEGAPEGKVQIFAPNGKLHRNYMLHQGKKTGEDWEYYLNQKEPLQPKLMIEWFEDKIQGMVKTWYTNGALESQRELSENKKHGLSLAYYESGELMLMEEYENELLVKGSYYKKGDSIPISSVENGEGIATLFNSQGHFLKKISYERKKPLVD